MTRLLIRPFSPESVSPSPIMCASGQNGAEISEKLKHLFVKAYIVSLRVGPLDLLS